MKEILPALALFLSLLVTFIWVEDVIENIIKTQKRIANWSENELNNNTMRIFPVYLTMFVVACWTLLYCLVNDIITIPTPY